MTADAGPALKALYDEFGDSVAFVTLYVREAHPGERVPQPRSMQEKLAHARKYQERDGIPWTVAVDDVDGTLHQQLDPKPSAAYIIDEEGMVAFRITWSNDVEALREAVKAVAEGRELERREVERMVFPALRGLGYTHEVLHEAGRVAKRDFRQELLPGYLMARLAPLFAPLPREYRGAAAAATSLLGIAATVGFGCWLVMKVAGNKR